VYVFWTMSAVSNKLANSKASKRRIFAEVVKISTR
jgi:hypothetical protein